VDFAAERGTPVLAARRGVVTHIASDSDRLHGFLGYGNAVVVYHPDGDRFSLYAHLSEVVVHVGQGVDAGQKVGRVGNTTNGKFHGMASHLHFEVRERMDDGRAPFPAPYRAYAIDPLDWLVAYGMELGPRRAVGLACSHDEH
jgi:murein DD-endopeptidase MepM/ murein hydrolase activator NlpD